MVFELEESYTSGANYNYASCNYDTDHNLSSWRLIAESTLPLKASKLSQMSAGQHNNFQSLVERRSKDISRRLILVNFISLLINLSLAALALYFAFQSNSPSTTAFAADCALDFISSAIVLWRYYGDLNSVYMEAREQIACIYLGALFELSALGIIIKATSDIVSGAATDLVIGYDLVYLASAATLACIVLTIFKSSLYRTVRDNSLLLDVINTLISTVFALSIIMSQTLINIDSSFWYLDPVLSIVLALFMAAFGLKVIHQNFNILRPVRGCGSAPSSAAANYATNLNASVENNRQLVAGGGGTNTNWQKASYSTISFV